MSRSCSGTARAGSAVSSAPLRARRLSATLDDGRVLFAGLEFALPPGPTALIGANGSGKTTLLRLLAGDLPRGDATVDADAPVAWVPQHHGCLPNRVVDLLGVGARVDALRRLLAGGGDAVDLACVDDAWSLEVDLRARLDVAGLSTIGLDADPARLSGGERQQLCLLAATRGDAGILLLDEPSTFLDAEASAYWRDAVLACPGTALVVTHDPLWLSAMPRIVELRGGALHWTDGNLDAWRAARDTRRTLEARMLDEARADRERTRRETSVARERLDRRSARGRRNARVENQSPLLLDHRADRADRTRSRAQAGLAQRSEAADSAVCVAFDTMEKRVAPDFIDAAALSVPAGRQLLSFRDAHPCAVTPRQALDWTCSGPARIGLMGRNGSGKSTLLRAIAGDGVLARGEIVAHVPVQSLDQHLHALPADASALDWLRTRMQANEPAEISTRLALLGLPGARARQPLGTLSGGERMRVAVAAAAWSHPAAPLLLLDEPASHLDFDSVDALVALLRAWPGALLVVSHDPALLESLELTHRLHLDADHLTLQ
ncbi:MAG: ATP-binding cassette domain-containing protein [Luteimonas sp.]